MKINKKCTFTYSNLGSELLKFYFIFRTLPPQFPQDPPSVTVSPPVNHSWLDSQGRITGCPSLNSVRISRL